MQQERPYGGPGFDLVERVRDTIRRHRMVEQGDAVLIALSGGPDSTCLLDVMRRLGGELGVRLEVAHVDHGLSDESRDIAAHVTSEAAAAGFEVHTVRAPDLAGPNLHARARLFRYSFFQTIAEQIGAPKIATGHTLDDRVETTLARLIHGAGTDGLAGIPPTDGTRIRPLISLRRSQTRGYCDEVGLSYFDDPANEDDRFERPAVRHGVLLPIEERWGDGAIRAIARSADRLAEDAAALRGLAETTFRQVAERDSNEVHFDKKALLGLPVAFRRRLLELAVGRVRDRAGGIDAALEALAEPGDGAGKKRSFAVVEGTVVDLTADKVVVRRAPEPGEEDEP